MALSVTKQRQDDVDSMLETISIMADEDMMEEIRRSVADAKINKTVPWREVFPPLQFILQLHMIQEEQEKIRNYMWLVSSLYDSSS